MSALSEVNIPSEILSSIIEYLPPSTLRNVRLVNKALSNTASRVLFRTVHLKVDLTSFDRLAAISKHNDLRNHVEELYYNGNESNPDAAMQGIEQWLESDFGRGVGLYPEIKRDFLESSSQIELQEFYLNFCRHIFGVERLKEGDNEARFLFKALSRFPRLARIWYSEESVLLGRSISVGEIMSRQTLAARTLSLPRPNPHSHGYPDRFWRLMSVIRDIGPSLHLKKLQCSCLGDGIFTKSYLDAMRDLSYGNDLQELDLEFKFSDNHPQERPASQIFRMLKMLINIRTVHLCLRNTRPAKRFADDIEVPPIFPNDLHWQYLVELKLQRVCISQSSFEAVLTNHSNTLQVLELSCITLINRSRSPTPCQALWIEMLYFMNLTLTLRHIRLYEFFEADFELWEAPGYYIESGSSLCSVPVPGSLIYRIEQFVLGEGQSPFTPRIKEAENTEPLEYPETLWVWDHDDTWLLGNMPDD